VTVPDFQALMLPLLKISSDRKLHNLQDIAVSVAAQLELSQDDLSELLPSGKQTRFYNRLGWARTHLSKAGLIKYVQRGVFQITERGLTILRENPEKVDLKLLDRFPEHLDFRQAKPVGQLTESKKGVTEQIGTPLEELESAFEELEKNLSEDFLDRVKNCSPSFFEKLVVDLLIAMGYGGSLSDVGQVLGRSGDGGIDGAIKEDRLGLDTIYIQAKRWEGSVGRPEIQKFAGALDGVRARKGVFITSSKFTAEAIEYSLFIDKKIVLIDGKKLAQLAIEFNLGVSIYSSYVIKRIDSDYFIED
jgi:restriction system protein